MVVGLPNGLFNFQEDAVRFLLDTTARYDSKEVITLKSPTGARVIIVTGCINVITVRVSETFIKSNSCIA
ncbi:MAG: hypothetical protein ACOX4U_08070 [Anaerovoracaceae bacterium]|jgi:hypothetical protein